MRYTRRFVTTATLFASIALVGAQDRGGKKGGGFQLPPMIHMTIADFADGGRIPNKYTCAAGQNSPSPAISWTGAPANTQSYVLILHDPDPVLVARPPMTSYTGPSSTFRATPKDCRRV